MVFPIIWSGGILLGLILHKQEICGNVDRSVTTADTHSFISSGHYSNNIICIISSWL